MHSFIILWASDTFHHETCEISCPSWEMVWLFPGDTRQVRSNCGMLSIPLSADPRPVWTQPIWACLIAWSSLQGHTCSSLCTLATPEAGLLGLLSAQEASLVFRVSSRNRKTEPFITLNALHESVQMQQWKTSYKNLKRSTNTTPPEWCFTRACIDTD